MKLLSYLQKQGISRRKITEYISQGKVFVNKEKIDAYNAMIKIGDMIEIQQIFNQKITCLENEEKIQIILYNKPKGYVVSKADKHNPTIYEILPPQFQKYYYLGRLDKESHGLLVMTNNAKLVNDISHPSRGIEKEYIVILDKELQEKDSVRCLQGVNDIGDILKAKSIEKEKGKHTSYKVVLLEGKNRHIRRMFAAIGYYVEDLQRIREGSWKLGNIALGERKQQEYLSSKE